MDRRAKRDNSSTDRELMTDQSKPETALRRAISKTGYSAITLNGVIGAGIFGLPAVAAAKTGAFSPWLFVIAGILIFSVVLSFARASSMFRHTGGAVLYANHAFGPFVGLQAGWLTLAVSLPWVPTPTCW